ncbi:MAG TPA: hypothetical protein VKG21_14215 [Casimicrobiaceae bacterium]|nr:hypothetical protein [Casimicrobiaceae bacterium]
MNSPTVALASLGFAGEYWQSNPRLYEGYEQLQQLYKSLGRKVSSSDVAYQLSRNLLSEVLVAAGGIEGALMRLRAAIAELQVWVVDNQLKAQPGIPQGLGHAAAVDAWFAFAELLMWSRTLVERMERRASSPKKFPKQGLLPALKPKRLKSRCEKIFAILQHSPVGQCRTLANFVLHTGLVNHPHTGARLEPSGAIVLPIPQLPIRPVAHWYLFSWQPGHDGVVLAEEMWRHVQIFVDDLLAAFEKAAPKRMRRNL